MYPFVVKVKYWDDFYEPWALTSMNVLVYAESFTAAADMIENHYVDNIESISVHAVADEGMLFEVTEEIADTLIFGEGDYAHGVKMRDVAKDV